MRLSVMAACGVAMATFATGVATPQTPTLAQTQAQMIVGAWDCSANTPDGVVAGRMTYKADGMTDSLLTFTAEIDDSTLVAQIETRSSWVLTGDGVIQEQILGATVNSAKLDGEEMPESVKGEIAKSVIMDLGPSTIEVSPTQMVLVDGEGTRTDCTR